MEYTMIGKPVVRVDALDKVLGKTQYTQDYEIKGMCYGKFFRSSVPHGKIKKLDVSKAEKLAGVKAVVTPQDAPPTRFGLFLVDRYLLPWDGIVNYVGEPVAAVVAITEDIAEEAVGLIEVEYEELPAVFDPKEAFKEKPTNIVHPGAQEYTAYEVYSKLPRDPKRPNQVTCFRIGRGDLEKGFAEADIIVENEYSMSRISHCTPETHQTVAWWESDGGITLVESIQGVWLDHLLVSIYYQVPPSKVRVIAPYQGCGFGGKILNSMAYIVPLLAKKAGVPVKVSLTREENFVDGLHRDGNVSRIKDGVTKDGKLVARHLEIVQEYGAYSGFNTLLAQNAAQAAYGTYNIPNFLYECYGVYTNLPLTGAYRGFGSNMVTWPVEQQMDIIAEKLNMDRAELRRRNFLKEGDTDVSGSPVFSIGIAEALEKTLKEVEWGKKEEGEYPWKIGKAVATSNKYTLQATTACVLVKVRPDGGIHVFHSASEMGQGIDTVVSQIAAEEFKTTIDKIKITNSDTACTPYDLGPCSSRSTLHVGRALQLACDDAKRQIYEVAAPMMETTPSELEIKGDKICHTKDPEKSIPLSQIFTMEGVVVGKNAEIIGQGSFTGPLDRTATSYAHVAVGVKLAVNVETGEIKILKIIQAGDCGQPINPKMVEQQLEGGLVQGVGAAIFEELIIKDGVIINPNYMDYKIPLATDIPSTEDLVSIIVSAPHKEGPYGAKGIGESPMVCPPPAIANAIYDAVGVRIKDLPITREKVFWELKKKAGRNR